MGPCPDFVPPPLGHSAGHLLNLLFNKDYNPNVSALLIWFAFLGLFFSQKRILPCGRERSLDCFFSLPNPKSGLGQPLINCSYGAMQKQASVLKPALARPSSKQLQTLNTFFY